MRINPTYHKDFHHCYLHSHHMNCIHKNGRCTFYFYTETDSWHTKWFLNEDNFNYNQQISKQNQKKH